MNDVTLNFERSEYDARIARTRAAMDAKGVSLMIVTDPSNMHWLTGYDGWSFYVHQCVLLALDGEPVWYGRQMDVNGALRTAFMDPGNMLGYPDHYVQSTERHPMDHLCGVIGERGWDKGTIGVEMDNYYFTAAAYASLTANLPNARFVDATGLVNWQRAVKSEREITYMRRAARIVEAMHALIVERAEPGLPKNQLVGDILQIAAHGADGHWGDYCSTVPMVPSGLDSTAPHLTWDDRPMQNNEVTFFEIGGCYRRYHCPQSRTLYLGKVPQKYLDAEAAVIDGIATGLEHAKPGNTCADVATAFFATMKRHGFHKEGRAGYAIGVSYPPDWGERTMSLRETDKTVLKAGMTFHFMPALWLDDGGLEITESILITDTGAEALCNTPRKLFVKD
jgi:ectoine hydrolase